jgi:beta-glucosidase
MKKTLLLLLLGLLLAACGLNNSTPVPAEPAATPDKMLYKDPSQPLEVRVEDLLARMTLDEKIAQMVQPVQQNIPAADVEFYSLGSVLSTAGSISESNSLADWTNIPRTYLEAALDTRLGIPLIYGVDSMHGFGHVNGATIFPHNIGLGATRDPDLVENIGQATAEEMRAAGIPWSFGPVVAVPQDIRWGRTYEGFSEDTALVTGLGEAYIRGFQAIPAGYPATPGQVYFGGATAKHFIGDGGTVWGSSRIALNGVQAMLDQGNMQVPEEELRRLFLPPYQAAVKADVMSIMASYSSWKGTKMVAQRYLLTVLLKGELGFQGFIVSDCAGVEQADGDYYTAVVTSIDAGVDMSMCPANHVIFLATVKQAVEAKDISQERIDDAVRRILRAKFKLGLFENPFGDQGLARTVGSDEHRQLARQAVRESLVLLKNDRAALPIDKNVSTLLFAGINDAGTQAGGWTLEWQGVTGDLLGATTIYQGIQRAVGADTQVLYDARGVFADFESTAPVGIAVVGERPYAEGVADLSNLQLSEDDIELINNLRLKVEKLVVIILSGRPLIITDQYQTADAWVAAWLPGSEGQGVADVLFGDVPFTGKSPYTWPRSYDQLPINENNDSGKTGCDAPLFPYGYGLGGAGSPPIEWIECP